MDLNTEIPKDFANKVYETVEKARKSGKIKKGTNEATKAVERGTAKLVVIAKDINPQEIIMHFPALCQEKDIPLVVVPSKEELGAAAGLPISTGAIAITQEGDAKTSIKEIVSKLK